MIVPAFLCGPLRLNSAFSAFKFSINRRERKDFAENAEKEIFLFTDTGNAMLFIEHCKFGQTGITGCFRNRIHEKCHPGYRFLRER